MTLLQGLSKAHKSKPAVVIYTYLLPALWRLRKETGEFLVNLGYTVRPSLGNKKANI